MSIRVTTRVWDQSSHDGSALLLLLALADMANDDGVCWPKLDQLATKARVDVRQTQRLLRELQDSGDLYVKAGGGRGRPSFYLVATGMSAEQLAGSLAHYFKLTPLEIFALLEAAPKKGDIQGLNPVTETTVSTPPISKRVTSRAGKGDIYAQATEGLDGPDASNQAPKRHDPSWEGGRVAHAPAHEGPEEQPTPVEPFLTESPGEPSPPSAPPLPAGSEAQALLAFTRSAGAAPTEFEQRWLASWADENPRGWHWVEQAVIDADMSGGLCAKGNRMRWLQKLLTRWARDQTYGSPRFDEMTATTTTRQEHDHGRPETSNPERRGLPAVQPAGHTSTIANLTPERRAELRARRLGTGPGGTPGGRE